MELLQPHYILIAINVGVIVYLGYISESAEGVNLCLIMLFVIVELSAYTNTFQHVLIYVFLKARHFL
jgi:hypothetical protein